MDTVVDEHTMLGAAIGGDTVAFGNLVRRYEPELRRFAYRMTGSLADADDVMQETLLRAWRGLAGFGGRGALQGWLYRVAANASIDLTRRRRRQLPGAGIPWDPTAELPEPEPALWISPFPEDPEGTLASRQGLSLAFVALLQQLSARARAIYVLREFVGASAEETAEWLSISTTAVNSSLVRSRAMLGAPQAPQTPTPEQRHVASRFADAWERGDIAALVALLQRDVTLAMPPFAAWYRGAEAAMAFVSKQFFSIPSQHAALPITANGSPAVALYRQQGDALLPLAIAVLTVSGDRIARVDAFVDGSLFGPFGLPASLDSEHRAP